MEAKTYVKNLQYCIAKFTPNYLNFSDNPVEMGDFLVFEGRGFFGLASFLRKGNNEPFYAQDVLEECSGISISVNRDVIGFDLDSTGASLLLPDSLYQGRKGIFRGWMEMFVDKNKPLYAFSALHNGGLLLTFAHQKPIENYILHKEIPINLKIF